MPAVASCGVASSWARSGPPAPGAAVVFERAGQPVQTAGYGAGASAPAQQSYSGYPNQDPYAQGGYQPGRKVKDGKGMGIASLVLGIVSAIDTTGAWLSREDGLAGNL